MKSMSTSSFHRSLPGRHIVKGGNGGHTHELPSAGYLNPTLDSHSSTEIKVQGSGKTIDQDSRKRFRSAALGSQDGSPSIQVFRSHPRFNRQRPKQRRYTSHTSSDLTADVESDPEIEAFTTSSASPSPSLRSSFGKVGSSSTQSHHNKSRKSNQNAATGFDPSESHLTQSYTSSEDSASDDSDLESKSTDDSTNASSSSSESGSDDEWNADTKQFPSTHSIEQPSDRTKVIFFSSSSALTAEQFSKVRKMLRADAPNANSIVMLETVKARRRASYSSRETLSRLMAEVFAGNVSEISVADSTHICSTKDGFQLFSWICGQFGTKVLISPELQIL